MSNDFEITLETLEYIINTRIDKTIDLALQGFLFDFKEYLNDIVADLAVINHEIGLLRKELEMEKRLTLALHEMD